MLTDKKIAPHIPVIDKSKREDGTLRAVRDPLTSVLPPAQLSPGICRPCRWWLAASRSRAGGEKVRVRGSPQSGIGVGLIALGIPGFYLFRWLTTGPGPNNQRSQILTHHVLPDAGIHASKCESNQRCAWSDIELRVGRAQRVLV
jgi:hypothetical protein